MEICNSIFLDKVLYNDYNITEINGTETSDIEGVMEFSFLFRNIKEIIFRKEFQESPIIKNDNKEKAWAAYYKQSDYCATVWDMDCVNEHIRAKRQFEENWR